MQIYADVLGVEVSQMADPLQANARGAALIAAVGLRRLAWTTSRAWSPVRRTYQPTAAHRQLYDQRVSIFKDLHRQMRGVYRRLNRQLV